MTDYTEEEVEGGAAACGSRECSRDVLAAVLPEHDKRVRAEVLREAADDLGMAVWKCWADRSMAVRLVRGRADAEEGTQKPVVPYCKLCGSATEKVHGRVDAEEGK